MGKRKNKNQPAGDESNPEVSQGQQPQGSEADPSNEGESNPEALSEAESRAAKSAVKGTMLTAEKVLGSEIVVVQSQPKADPKADKAPLQEFDESSTELGEKVRRVRVLGGRMDPNGSVGICFKPNHHYTLKFRDGVCEVPQVVADYIAVDCPQFRLD